MRTRRYLARGVKASDRTPACSSRNLHISAIVDVAAHAHEYNARNATHALTRFHVDTIDVHARSVAALGIDLGARDERAVPARANRRALLAW
jgi:hypothetical protein